MKRYVKSSNYWGTEPKFKGKWSDEEKALWESIDWEEWWNAGNRGFDYPIPEDTFEGVVYAYGIGATGMERRRVKMIKYIRSNDIYPPYYAPSNDDVEFQKFVRDNHLLGPMYDGQQHNGYDIHNRYETQEVYDMMST